jgi:hypothetical protein
MTRLNENTLDDRKMGENTAVYGDTTCCIIKPHLVSSGMAGAALYEIQKAGFEISAIQMVSVKFDTRRKKENPGNQCVS